MKQKIQAIPVKELGWEDVGGELNPYLSEEIWTIWNEDGEVCLAEPDDDGSQGYWDVYPTVKAAKQYLAKREKENLKDWRLRERGREE